MIDVFASAWPLKCTSNDANPLVSRDCRMPRLTSFVEEVVEVMYVVVIVEFVTELDVQVEVVVVEVKLVEVFEFVVLDEAVELLELLVVVLVLL